MSMGTSNSSGQPGDDIERRIIVATQAGLPLVPDPWSNIAEQVGVPVDELLQRLRAMLDSGLIRRIGAVPNHYAIGYTANGMSVWDIADDMTEAVGEYLGGLAAVTHCYRRPRRLPQWPYNVFAMVHGRSRDAVSAEIDAIAVRLESCFPRACRARDVLYSSAILKKTGLRIGA
jgi:DNA-binding Lrp family transcriptional regulator